MRTNLNNLRKNIKNTVSSLSPENKAELYFQKRKHSVKLGMECNERKFKEATRKCDELYNKNVNGPEYYNFHNAHHKFMDWTTDYVYFQRYQDVLAGADRERSIYKSNLQMIETLEYLLENYDELGHDFTMDNSLKMLKMVKDKTETTIKEYNETIPQIEQQVEDNEYFRKNNYFQDVDSLGYKNLSWKKFMNYRCNNPNIPSKIKE